MIKQKIFIFLTLFQATIFLSWSQIGINIENPQELFYIDAKGDTSGNANISDDVVISSDGNIGVGTNLPLAKLDIRTLTIGGGFRLQDGTEMDKKILVSNASGDASWGELKRNIVAGVVSNVDVALADNYRYLGMYVTVPAGRSRIYLGGMVRYANGLGYVTLRLASSLSSHSLSSGILVNPGLAGFAVHTGVVVGQAAFFVENATSTPLTLYIWGTLYGGASSGTWALANVSEPYIFVIY